MVVILPVPMICAQQLTGDTCVKVVVIDILDGILHRDWINFSGSETPPVKSRTQQWVYARCSSTCDNKNSEASQLMLKLLTNLLVFYCIFSREALT